MAKIKTINVLQEDLLNDIFNKEIIIYEDIQGSKIYVNYDGENFTIRPKSLSAEPINLVDLALQRYYNKAINFFYALDDRVKKLLPKNWTFCFEYFPDEQPANIKYDKVPLNNLILTGICKGKKFDYKVDELREFSTLLNTEYLPVIFKGILNQKQVEAIKYFINTSEEDLEYVFGQDNFSFFFYKLLNPSSDASFLMEDEFQDNLEKLIIRIDGQDVSFQILNPLYEKISSLNNTDFTEIYSLILLNFLDYCQLLDIDNIKIKGDKRDTLYINLMSRLFNLYMNDTKEDIKQFDFTVPKFFDKDKFKINTELIDNKLTKEYIDESSKIEYVFKVILGSFKKERKKPIGLFTEKSLNIFNSFIKQVNDKLDVYLNKAKEAELLKHGLLDFDKYYDISYDIDGTGDVYPDMFDEFEEPSGSKKGKEKFKDDKMPSVDIDDIKNVKK